MSYNYPEPNLNPPEPTIICYCKNCCGEIYKGETCYRLPTTQFYLCSDCYDDTWQEVAGEED